MSPFNSGLFVEHKDVLGLTVRAAVRNLLGADDILERSVFGAVAMEGFRSRRSATAASVRFLPSE
jgi:hypothetical protein